MFAAQLLILMVAYARASDLQSVKWSKPVSGNSFNPGDAIEGEWAASTAVVSPSFKLCTYAGDVKDQKRESGSENTNNNDSIRNCGTAIWPAVKGDDDGVFTVTMYAFPVLFAFGLVLTCLII